MGNLRVGGMRRQPGKFGIILHRPGYSEAIERQIKNGCLLLSSFVLAAASWVSASLSIAVICNLGLESFPRLLAVRKHAGNIFKESVL